MDIRLLQFLVAALTFQVETTSFAQSDCLEAKFTTLANHTACLKKSAYAEEPQGVSEDEAKKILDQHNELRASILEARNMQKMSWDDELAAIAQKWGDNCFYDHEDPSSRRTIPGRFSVGQNLAIGYGEWSHVLQAWFNETALFTYGDKINNVFKDVGHYTQLVWAESSKIGCGFTTCANVGKFYVCNYGPAGNLGDWTRPYFRRAGSQCDSCPNTCVTSGQFEGLCDCNGTVCSNGGKLDLNSCTCTCLQPEPLHLPAENCAVNCTGTQDDVNCGPFYKDCTANVADYCPHMCDVCPFAAFDYKEEPNTGGNPRANADASGTTPGGSGVQIVCSSTLCCFALTIRFIMSLLV